jgi:hypothetical protein
MSELDVKRSVPLNVKRPDVRNGAGHGFPRFAGAARTGLTSAGAGAPDPRGKIGFEGAGVSCDGWTSESLISPFATLTGSWAVNDPSATNVAQIVICGRWAQIAAHFFSTCARCRTSRRSLCRAQNCDLGAFGFGGFRGRISAHSVIHFIQRSVAIA